ncbi:MAG TPA: hypothetical protein DIW47_12845 [Bacteroidetes bacterium]|nr:hypothetical protein [Bacteroidota bacterium]
MKFITAIFLISISCNSGNAQFDSTGYRFLFFYDKENTSLTLNYKDTAMFLLKNTGSKKSGFLVEEHSLISSYSATFQYLFEENFNQRSISHIGVEGFDFDRGRLAILSNQGVYYAASPKDRINLVSSEISAFEYDGVFLKDSMVYLYRNSSKTHGPFLDIISIHLITKEITRYASENDIKASSYSNFDDTKLLDLLGKMPIRADYVLPLLYIYDGSTDTFSLHTDSLYVSKTRDYVMSDDLIAFISSYTGQYALKYMDTTLKMNHSFYANRQLNTNQQGDKFMLLASYPGPLTTFNPQFILSEWSLSGSIPIMERFLKIETVENKNQQIRHAFDVINPWGVTHITSDERYYYFVVRNATQLEPEGKTLSEYYKANYSLQFGNTGFSVIRIEKGKEVRKTEDGKT